MRGTLNRRQSVVGALATVCALQTVFAAQTSERRLLQGHLVRGRASPGASIALDNQRLRVGTEGSFVFGIAWDRRAPAMLTIRTPGCARTTRVFDIERRQYGVERIDQLPGKFVTPENREVMARVERENQLIEAARMHDTDEAWFMNEFDWPVEGDLSNSFGAQRVLNGQKRRPHFGVDIAASEGTPVAAPQRAIVRLAADDFYFSGGTVILDHGHGVSTSYLHMRRIEVTAGQSVGRGQRIGAVGKTGRATGPHLCWRLNWFQKRLDVLSVLPGASTDYTLAAANPQAQSCSKSNLMF